MEKISGILPSSSRITAVDLKSSGAVRSGTPSYGRPVGLSSVAERELQRTTAQNATAIHERVMAQRSNDPRAQIVQKMADDFFIKSAKVEADPMSYLNVDANSDLNPETSVEPTTKINWSNAGLGPIKNDEFFIDNTAAKVTKKVEAEVKAEDLDRPTVGGYLDIEA